MSVATRAVDGLHPSRCRAPSARGRHTWADMGKAYDLLDDDTKNLIEGRNATHD